MDVSKVKTMQLSAEFFPNTLDKKSRRMRTMYKFATKGKREDVIALRWPKACIICGKEAELSAHPDYAIIGEFYEEKGTQVLVKMPGFFYTCKRCKSSIEMALSDECEIELLQSLLKHPWTEIIEIQKDGTVKVQEGIFKEKLEDTNPDVRFKSKKGHIERLLKEYRE